MHRTVNANMKNLFNVFVACSFIFFTSYNNHSSAQDHLYSEISNSYLNKLIVAAKLNYPKMKTFQNRVKIAQISLDKNKKTWYDFINFSMSYSPSNTVTVTGLSLSGYQIGFGFNLAALLQKKHNIKLAKEEVAIAELSLEEYERNLEATVKQLYYTYMQHVVNLRLQNQSALDIEASYKQIKYRFEKAEETFQNYNAALVSYTSQKQNIISLESAVLISKANLEELLGKKLEDIR